MDAGTATVHAAWTGTGELVRVSETFRATSKTFTEVFRFRGTFRAGPRQSRGLRQMPEYGCRWNLARGLDQRGRVAALWQLGQGRRRRRTTWKRFPPNLRQQVHKALNPECRRPRFGALVGR